MKQHKLLIFVLFVSIFLVFQSRTVSAQVDAYADAVVETGDRFGSPGQLDWLNLPNALGAPDQVYASSESGMYNDLEAYILLDMGEGEEIIDDIGVDFYVYFSSCGFEVFVSNDTSSFEYVGYESFQYGAAFGTFDIGNDDGAIYRYVKVTAYSGWLSPTEHSEWNLDGIQAYDGHYIPEFPAGILLPLFMAITLLMAIVYRVKEKRVS